MEVVGTDWKTPGGGLGEAYGTSENGCIDGAGPRPDPFPTIGPFSSTSGDSVLFSETSVLVFTVVPPDPVSFTSFSLVPI